MSLIPQKRSHKLNFCHVLSHSSHVSPDMSQGGYVLMSVQHDQSPQEYTDVVMLYLALPVADCLRDNSQPASHVPEAADMNSCRKECDGLNCLHLFVHPSSPEARLVFIQP